MNSTHTSTDSENIVQAIKQRDPVKAEKAVQLHIRSAQKRRMTRLFSMQLDSNS